MVSRLNEKRRATVKVDIAPDFSSAELAVIVDVVGFASINRDDAERRLLDAELSLFPNSGTVREMPSVASAVDWPVFADMREADARSVDVLAWGFVICNFCFGGALVGTTVLFPKSDTDLFVLVDAGTG